MRACAKCGASQKGVVVGTNTFPRQNCVHFTNMNWIHSSKRFYCSCKTACHFVSTAPWGGQRSNHPHLSFKWQQFAQGYPANTQNWDFSPIISKLPLRPFIFNISFNYQNWTPGCAFPPSTVSVSCLLTCSLGPGAGSMSLIHFSASAPAHCIYLNKQRKKKIQPTIRNVL